MNFDQLVSLCRDTHEEIQNAAVKAVDLSRVDQHLQKMGATP
jgi:hypothetical protein